MANVFPNSNLASSSQPWGREVQKRVEILESQLSLERTNGATVDAQLQSSYRRLDQTVKDLIQADLDIQAALGQSNQAITDAASAASAAQTAANDAAAAALTANSAATNATSAINGLIGLGSSGSGYTLNVSNITTGGTLRDGVLTLDSGSNSSVAIFNGGVDINGPAGQVKVGNSGAGGIRLEGSVTSNGLIQSGGNMRSGATLGRIELDNAPAVTGASINTNGNIIRTASSERYKTDISNLQLSYEQIINAPNPKIFRLKDDVFGCEENNFQANEDARYYAGFIAEDFANTDLEIFVSHMNTENGQIPDGFYYAEFTSALLLAIKHQDELIKSLTERIVTLENDKV